MELVFQVFISNINKELILIALQQVLLIKDNLINGQYKMFNNQKYVFKLMIHCLNIVNFLFKNEKSKLNRMALNNLQLKLMYSKMILDLVITPCKKMPNKTVQEAEENLLQLQSPLMIL